MSFYKRRKDAQEAMDEFVDEALKRYKIAMIEDFAEVGIKLGDQVQLANLDTLLKALDDSPRMDNSISEVISFLKNFPRYLIDIERSMMPSHSLLFVNPGWGLIGYRPENAWEEAKFLEQVLYEWDEGSEPLFFYPRNGKLVSCCFDRWEFLRQFWDMSRLAMEELTKKDGRFTSCIYENFEGSDSMFFEYPTNDLNVSTSDGAIEYFILEKLRSESLSGETWEE